MHRLPYRLYDKHKHICVAFMFVPSILATCIQADKVGSDTAMACCMIGRSLRPQGAVDLMTAMRFVYARTPPTICTRGAHWSFFVNQSIPGYVKFSSK